MSAWTIGGRTIDRRKVLVRPSGQAQVVSLPDETSPGVDALIAWIPGEVVAAYAAIVLALQPKATGDTAPPLVVTPRGWLIAGVILAGVLTFLGAWSKSDDLEKNEWKELGVRVVLSAVAFAIWSFVVPGSWWYSIESVSTNQTLIPIIAGVVGAAFGLFAEGLARRVGK